MPRQSQPRADAALGLKLVGRRANGSD